MKILVDADACPKVIKEILFRAAKRLKLQTIFFANHAIHLPPSPFLKFVLVSKGFDVADKKIECAAEPGDLVITGDLPLANDIIEKNAHALNPNGTFYTEQNIKEKLAMRNLVTGLRDAGMISGGGPSSMTQKDQQAFANALDTFLAKHLKKN